LILAGLPHLRYGSVSGNYCTDKKATAVNGILGRGKNVVAEITVPRDVVDQRLHTTAARIAALNIRKNLIGTVLAGGIRSANAHYANKLLAFYLATGQDAANIVVRLPRHHPRRRQRRRPVLLDHPAQSHRRYRR
jgi:hydroxymethylglutaryl-CoA reductase (NADPH)